MTDITKSGRFDYVKFSDRAAMSLETFKDIFKRTEFMIDGMIHSPRAKALALTNLEQAYMWVGKGLRDDQLNTTNVTDTNPTSGVNLAREVNETRTTPSPK